MTTAAPPRPTAEVTTMTLEVVVSEGEIVHVDLVDAQREDWRRVPRRQGGFMRGSAVSHLAQPAPPTSPIRRPMADSVPQLELRRLAEYIIHFGATRNLSKGQTRVI